MRRLAVWLGIAAIALQSGWPLLAGALPRSVALVPLCTVDGVTHYVEVPTGKTPLEQSSSHGGHCPQCWVGGIGMSANIRPLALPEGRAAQAVSSETTLSPKSAPALRWPRGPPFFPVVILDNHEPGRNDEEALLFGRAPRGAPDRGRLVRLGVLHH